MRKPAKTQWEFGDLFAQEPAAPTKAESPPEAEPRRVLGVSDLTIRIRQLLEDQVGMVWVSGEISNLRIQSSGHAYFTLKDSTAQLACVLFKGERKPDRSLLEDGRKVVLQGQLTVYEARGQYQLRVLGIEQHGVGALQAAFEKLKQKLNAEGMFAAERKRALPEYPRRVGIVTSATGAAIRDVLHVTRRRNPALEYILYPCRVQGEGAAREIAGAIRTLNDFHAQMLAQGRSGETLDLILVTRGGGSLEDLWAFNEEEVARAIFESALPVVSAVGHEIDFTISDFVADVRAPTPSAAAEIITEAVFASCEFLGSAGDLLERLALRRLGEKVEWLDTVGHRLNRCHPRRRLEDLTQRLDDYQSSLTRCARSGWRQKRTEAQGLMVRLGRLRPEVFLQQRREIVELSSVRLREVLGHRIADLQHRLEAAQNRLRLLGPEQVLARGYSITLSAETGKVIRKTGEVSPGMVLKTRLSDGEITSRASAKAQGDTTR